MNHWQRVIPVTVVLWIAVASSAAAQDGSRIYVGGLFGVSTLSADASSVTTATSASASMYKPENGPALNVYAGAHLGRFFTIQANYVWNRNDIALFSSFVVPEGGGFYEQPRESSQSAIVADALLYFRALGSGVRPYLSTGLGLMRFTSAATPPRVESRLTAPGDRIASTQAVLRVAVGIDLAAGRRWSFRYSFSETISRNPVSPQLAPEGKRGLANFQNLFGVVRHF
jgi:hypothetical protein